MTEEIGGGGDRFCKREEEDELEEEEGPGRSALSRGSSPSWRPTGPLRPTVVRRQALRPPVGRPAIFGLPPADRPHFGPLEADGC